MPSPRLTLPRLRAPTRVRRNPARPRTEPVVAVVPAPPPEPPAPIEIPPQAASSSDSAILARILALFDVWNEPPPAWMAEALRDEVVLLSPDAWPTLESLGSQGLDLLTTLQAYDMLPESPAALRAIGEVETLLRAGIGAGIEAGGGETALLPPLTLAAAWLCEALENFLAAQAAPTVQPERLDMARTMLDQAMRGMSEPDWASLDRFPEKASRVRVLTDRLREDMRRPAAAQTPPPEAVPQSPVETVVALLKQVGFALEAAIPDANQAPLLAQREDMLLLVQAVDLRGGAWRLPEGLLGPWANGGAPPSSSPGRQLWQRMARRRLRPGDPRPLAGLLVLHGGRIEEEAVLAGRVAADRHRSGIGLAWLDGPGALPSLQQEISDLRERALRGRWRERSADHAAATS